MRPVLHCLGRFTCALTGALLVGGWLAAGEQPGAAVRVDKPPEKTLLNARQRVLRARPLATHYYYDDARGLESLQAHAGEISLLAPQSYWADAEGFVHGDVPPQVKEIVRRTGLPVMPLLVNRGFDRATASAMLRSAKAQHRAIAYLAYLAKRDDYVGFQIDIENIDPADKDALTRFVERAAARLHRDGRLLSVAVVPRFSDTHPGLDPMGQFRTGEWGAPYDYRTLGRIADFVVLMAYDQHGRNTPPGPVAGYAWVRAALDYAIQRVPRSKLLLGIPLYSRDWTETGQGYASNGLAFAEVSALLQRPDVQSQWNKRWRTPWLQYRAGSALRTIWFEDERSLREKLSLVVEYHLRGFAAWRLGFEDPRFWTLANAIGKAKPAAPPKRTTTSRAAGGSPDARLPARSTAASPQE